MSLEVPFRKLLPAVAIVAGHALALYGLTTLAPPARTMLANTPISLQFISQAEPLPERTLPPPAIARIAPSLAVPVMPPMQIAVPNAAAIQPITVSRHAVTEAVIPRDEGAARVVDGVEYVREPIPRYPPQSRRMREEGLVVLRVLIDEQGHARSVDVEASSGHSRLDQAAREAVAAAVFRPYMEDGAPRRALVLIPIEFALKRSAA